MKIKNVLRAVAAAAVLATASLSASAAYVIVDGWQMNVPNFTPTLTKDIGHLVVGGGLANVEQQTDMLGNVFVGALFKETGNIFSLNYITENSVGNGDSGFAKSFGVDSGLELRFNNVKGYVDSFAGTGFHYTFTSGEFGLYGSNDGGANFIEYANGSLVGLGGNTSSTNVIGGTAGNSNVLAQVFNMIDGFEVFDSAGVSLESDFGTGKFLFQATTTNTLDSTSPAGGLCNFGEGETGDLRPCVSLKVTSEGALNVVRKVPEPGSIALLGLGLLGLGAMRRRQVTK
jgi:hypothetical protein